MPKRPQKKSNQPSESEQPVSPEHPDARPEPGDIGLQAIATLDKHKKIVIIGTLLVGVAICVGLVARQIADQRRTVMAEAFSLAASERSIEKLDAVVADYSGSAAAGNSLLTKSEIQLSLDKPEDAKISLLTFVENYKKHPRYVQGLFALGNLHHNTGDRAKADDSYQQALAAGPDSDIAPLIVIRQGDLALEAADNLLAEGKTDDAEAKKDEARTFYEESIRRINFRANRFIPLAEEKISLLAIGDVPTVPAPPPPPEPEKPDPAAPIPGLGPVPGINPAPGVESGFKLFKPEDKTPKPDSDKGTPKPDGDAAAAPAEKQKGKGTGKGEGKAKSKEAQPKGPGPAATPTTPKKATPSAPKPVPAEKPAAPKPAPAEKPAAPAPAPNKKPAPAEKPDTPAAPQAESEKPAVPTPVPAAPAPSPKPE